MILYMLLAISSASMVCLALNPVRGVLGTVLTMAPVRYVGKISYGLYLIHPFVFRGIGRFTFRSSLEEIVAALTLSLALSALSWHFVEHRFIRLKGRPATKRTAPVEVALATASAELSLVPSSTK